MSLLLQQQVTLRKKAQAIKYISKKYWKPTQAHHLWFIYTKNKGTLQVKYSKREGICFNLPLFALQKVSICGVTFGSHLHYLLHT